MSHIQLSAEDIRVAGECGLLIDLVDLPAALNVRTELADRPVPGQRALVAGARTVLVLLDGPQAAGRARERLLRRTFAANAEMTRAADVVDVPVVYDGDDLLEVAELTGLDADRVVAAHTGSDWTVAFSGFAPGFGYLAGGDQRLVVPRRSVARTSVPAGSVGLAGEFSGVYPRASPGGWQLIGRTDVVLWDAERDPPGLFTPGRRVRFRQVDRLAAPVPSPPSLADPLMDMGFEVLKPGILSLIEDLGRFGWLGLGVPESGVADRAAAIRANRMVGNPPECAVLEVVLGGLVLRAHGDQVVAVTGAAGPVAVTSAAGPVAVPDAGVEISTDRPIPVPDGAELRVSVANSGLRRYVAVRGGFATPATLGSRSADVLSGLGPAPLRRGDRLPVGTEREGSGPPSSTNAAVTSEDPAELEVLMGPRADWFTAEATRRLISERYQVTPQSNRVGVRLAGPPLERAIPGELPSEGLVCGAIQVPPSGEPVIFLADHPVTGGYPVIGVLTLAAIDRAAQLRPGAWVAFRLAEGIQTVARSDQHS